MFTLLFDSVDGVSTSCLMFLHVCPFSMFLLDVLARCSCSCVP